MKFKSAVLVILLSIPIPFSLHAIQISPLTSKEIMDRSELIFRGVCEKKLEEAATHPKTGKEIPVIVFVFSTGDVFKGLVGSKIELKQLKIRSAREAYALGIYGPLNAVSYEVGKEYLLFLGAESVLGFRSLVGGNAGKILIHKDAAGKERVAVTEDSKISKNVSYEEFADQLRKNLHE